MLLSSSLEPNGPKSRAHYIILHYNNQRDLVELPETYSDLSNLVKKLYHINPDTFFVETKELNICTGESIRIPKDLWGGIAELLGNIDIILNTDVSGHPESSLDLAVGPSHPEPATSEEVTGSAQNTIYQQILACDPLVSGALENVRKEITSGNPSSSGIKWRGKQIPANNWSNTDWTVQPYSVFVIQYNFSESSSSQLDISFVNRDQCSLIITLRPNGNVLFGERLDSGAVNTYHNLNLLHSMHAAGDHSIAIVQNRGHIHVVFDFKQATFLQRKTIVERVPKKIYSVYMAQVPTCSIDIGVYEFDGNVALP